MDDEIRTLPILCEHQWQDYPYPDWVTVMMTGIGDMSGEMRQHCPLCAALRWVPIGEPFSLAEVMEEPEEEGAG